MSPDSGALAVELREAVGMLVRSLRTEPRLPLGQAVVLAELRRRGPRCVTDLAEEARVRPQSMGQTVKKLQDAGFVVRRRDPDDGRRAFVHLTDAGVEAIEADRQRRDGRLAGALSVLSDEEREVLHSAALLLSRIADS